jgi:uncharacterized repeat protein (TIGR01451 family)
VKAGNTSTPAEGGTVVYMVTVTNNGTSSATSVAVADTLPTGLTFVSATATAGSYASPNWTVGTLASGASATLTITATVNLGTGGSNINNSATASSTLYDAYPANNSASFGLTVKTTTLSGTVIDAVTHSPLSGVTVQVTGTSCTATTGGNGSYSFTSGVSSCLLAPGAATVATTNAPAGYILISAGTTIVAGTANLKNLGLVRPSLSGVVTDKGAGAALVGATVTFTQGATTCTTTTGAGGSYSFVAGSGCNFTAGTATVSASQTGYEPSSASPAPAILDSGPTTQNLQLGTVDLVITKTDGLISVQPGQQVSYLLTVVNNGSIAAANVTLADVFPTTYLDFGSDNSGITPVYSSGTYSWTRTSDLAPGATWSFTVVATVKSPLSVGTSIANYAHVSTTSAEKDITNNEVSDVDTVSANTADLTITKTNGKTQVLAGEALTYTIGYQNKDSRTATGVKIIDTLLNGVTYVSSVPSGTYDANARTITWTVGALAASTTGSITVNATVDATVLPFSAVGNRATISDNGANGPDINPGDNTATDSDVVLAPGVVLEKQASGPVYVGNQLVYTLNWKNVGAAMANNVVITDTLPANTTLVSGSIIGGGTESGGVITWDLGNKAADASGSVSFAVTVSPGAGGALQTTPTLSTESGSGSLTVTSSTTTPVTGSTPFCEQDKCAAFKGVYQGANGTPPVGYNENPRMTTFTETGWTQPGLTDGDESGKVINYWTSAANLSAEWVTMNVTQETSANYSFYRQPFCLPLNATGLSATLKLAGDDISDIYLNGTYLGRKIGAGAAATFPANPPDTVGIQSGINILAVQLLNNRHGGHAEFSGGDHSGLLFNLGATYNGLRPFVSGPSTIITGQSVTFTVDEQALGGRRPYEYKIDFGDGSAPVAYQAGTTFTHTYSTPDTNSRTYTATITARAEYGCTGSDPVTVTVLPAASSLLANAAAVAYRDTATSYHSFSGASGAGVEVLQKADLAMVKSRLSGGTIPGQGVTYQLVVTNNGPNAVTDAVVSDTLPATVTGVTWSCASSGGGSCAHASGSGSPLTETVSLSSGATATYTVLGTVSATATGLLSNTATVTAPADVSDLIQGNNSSTASSTLVPIAVNDGTYSVPYFTPYSGNILTNDVGSLLAVVTVTGSSTCSSFACSINTAHGLVYVQTNGTFRYEPNLGYYGADSFTYTARDSFSQTTSSATVGFIIQPPVPSALNDSGITSVNRVLSSSSPGLLQSVNNGSILANDTGLGLALYSATGSGAACSGFPCTVSTSHGSVVIQSGGSYVYTPAKGYSGVDSFTYVAKDSANQTAGARVDLTVIPILECDIDGDGLINIDDINLIFAARGQSATVGDPRDLDGDRLITVNDARGCVLRCDNPVCVK